MEKHRNCVPTPAKLVRKSGTTHFFRIASAYVIWHEVRLTLALTYVLPEDRLA